MAIIDFEEARNRHYLNKTEYIGSVTITLSQDKENGQYAFFLNYADNMDYETMQLFVMDVLEDIYEERKIRTFEIKAEEILNRPIILSLYLPKDLREDYILYQYVYADAIEEEVEINVLVAILTNLANNL